MPSPSPYHNNPVSSYLLILITLCLFPHIPPTISTVDHHHHDHPTPYLSPLTFSANYKRMLSTFKIFPYAPPLPFNHTTPSSALFHSSLLSSSFITTNHAVAQLFYLPTPPDLPTRHLDRAISRLRSSFPFWSRSLAADHFFLSSCRRTAAAAASSSRNVVELRKNAIRVACFSSPAGYFIPHKDVSLPPSPLTRFPLNRTRSGRKHKYLAYFKMTGTASLRVGADLIHGLRADPEFMIESQPLDDEGAYVDTLGSSKFCLFPYEGEVMGLGEALAYGCVPVMITDRPIQDMPLIDVLRWQEIALFVGSDVGPARLKHILNDLALAGDKKYKRMKRLGVAASRHFAWNDPPKPYDAFHMVVYQLWKRRHAVRYATWEMR